MSRDALEVFLSDSRWPWCLTKSLHWYDNLTQAGLCVRCQVSGVRCQVSGILGYQATGGNISIQDHQQSSTTELKAVAHRNAAAHLLSITQHGAIK